MRLPILFASLFGAATLAALVLADPPARLTSSDLEPPDRPAALSDEKSITRQQAVIDAARDLVTLPPPVQPYIRYLTLCNWPAAKRKTAARVLNGHLNGLSREPDIVPFYRDLVLYGNYLIRINLKDYRIDPKVWEQLADAKPLGEPYFHVRLETLRVTDELEQWPGGYDRDGRYYAPGQYRQRREKKGVVAAAAPVLAETQEGYDATVALSRLTGSTVPIVSATWFFYQTAISVDRVPKYSDFLGIKNEKDFQKAGGFLFDKQKIDPSFLRELAEAVARSTVAKKQPRGIVHYDSLGGDYWFTNDFRIPIDRSNPLRVENDRLLVDAHEEYIHLPNGLWAMGLFQGNNTNADGQIVDSVPDFIAGNVNTTNEGDTRIHLPLGCIHCHADGGMKDIKPWFRNVLNEPPNFLHSADPDDARRIRQKYVSRRLEPYLDRGREKYASALFLATGWTPREYSREYVRFWREIVDDGVDLEYAARDVGVPASTLRSAFLRVSSPPPGGAGSIDPVLSTFNREKPVALGLEQWYEVLFLADLAARGLVPVDDSQAAKMTAWKKAFPLAKWLSK